MQVDLERNPIDELRNQALFVDEAEAEARGTSIQTKIIEVEK